MKRTRFKPRNQVLSKFQDTVNYFGDNSVLHGVGQIFSMKTIPFLKKFFWLLVLILSSIGAAAIFRGVLSLYSAGAISYSVETTYLNWDTLFPAVTVCEQPNADILSYHVKRLNTSLTADFLKDISFWNPKFCKTCSKCDAKTCDIDIQKMWTVVRRDCSSIINNCQLGDKTFSCCERFKPIVSELGQCFVFNSKIVLNESDLLYVNRNHELPTLQFTVTDNVGLRVHPPDSLITVVGDNILGDTTLTLGTKLDIILKVEETTNDPLVLQIPPAARGCLLSYERPDYADLWPFKYYSYDACVWYNRAMDQVRVCNCTHPFVPKLGDIPSCGVRGLGCLAEVMGKKNSNFMAGPYVCPMYCSELNYKVVHKFEKLSKLKKPTKSTVSVKLAQLPTLRVLRHAVRDMMTLVVDVGGVGGVFFGASVLGVIEIFYLFCVRRGK